MKNYEDKANDLLYNLDNGQYFTWMLIARYAIKIIAYCLLSIATGGR